MSNVYEVLSTEKAPGLIEIYDNRELEVFYRPTPRKVRTALLPADHDNDDDDDRLEEDSKKAEDGKSDDRGESEDGGEDNDSVAHDDKEETVGTERVGVNKQGDIEMDYNEY
ncbi:unnamed protein product [Zymoseptoria tritici ST99CH_3D1]|nr:unnamed protein product [Zymoseptoria tritici ST99CH_3D1]